MNNEKGKTEADLTTGKNIVDKLDKLIPHLHHRGWADGDDGTYHRELTYEEWDIIINACKLYRDILRVNYVRY